MDVLSDVLLAVRLTGAVFFDVDAGAPFATETPSIAAIGQRVLAGPQHVISFHVVTEGTCWAEVVDRSDHSVALSAGDMVVFPRGDANIIASAPGMRGTPDPGRYDRPDDRTLPFSVTMTGEPGADRTRFVCGFLGCDARPFNPLLDALPRLVHAPVSEESRRWVAGLLDAAVRSSSTHTAGSEAVLAKLAELMFVEAIRNHIARLPAAARGWLAGVRDPQVGAALRLMHGRPAEPWTVERLAHGVGMSRSAFVQRFSAYVRIPPMQYLARWRLQLAARMLETGTVSVAQASTAVGYQSEAAFNRAFKREVGLAPGTWRRGRGRARSGT
ncbi:MAG: transcriptional regulator, AraC family [Actinomycetospora sp.]|jgi:AraC-like DNA-binding protein|nr:transcriptional regulator, AraC family [Actinomycetospora sp.]